MDIERSFLIDCMVWIHRSGREIIDVTSYAFAIPIEISSLILVWGLFRFRQSTKPAEPPKYETYEVFLPTASIFLATLVVWILDSISVNPFGVFPKPSQSSIVMISTLFLLAPTIIILRATRRGFRSVRLTFAGTGISSLLGILASLMLLIPTALLSRFFLVALSRVDSIYLISLVYNAFCEELFFRGLMQTRLESFFGSKTGLFITAVIFSLSHAPSWMLVRQLSAEAFIANVILSLPFAILLGYIARKSGNLVGSTIVHVANDLPLLLLT